MTPRTTLALAAILAGASSLALPAAAHDGDRFEAMDTNGDGYVDQAEVQAAQDARFAEADANGDGALDADEMNAMRDKRMAGRAEMAGKHASATFEALDADKSGAISREEFEAAVEMRKSRRADHAKGHRDRRQARMMQRMDANGDGMIQKEEISGGFVTQMFARLDTDKDGRVSKAEADAARGFMKHKRGN